MLLCWFAHGGGPPVPKRPHRLVVTTSRCGRDNPGSNPGEDIFGEMRCRKPGLILGQEIFGEARCRVQIANRGRSLHFWMAALPVARAWLHVLECWDARNQVREQAAPTNIFFMH